MGSFGAVIAVIIFVACPALFISIGFLLAAHVEAECPRSWTLATDIATPITIFVGAFVPITVILVFRFRKLKTKSRTDWGRIFRFMMSELRMPGFWDAKVRNVQSVRSRARETRKDRCSVCCFFVYILSFVLLLCAFLGLELANSGTSKEKDTQIMLYNGVTMIKPELNTSQYLASYRVKMDNGEVAAAIHPVLVQGPIIEQHVHDFYVYRNNFKFAYTFAPGSRVTLNITAGSNMDIFYQRNGSTVMNHTQDTSFLLDFTEQYHTSYLVTISSPSSSSMYISYDLYANTTTYDKTFVHKVDELMWLSASPDAYLIFWKNVSDPTTSAYVRLKSETYNALSAMLPPYVWKLAEAAVIILSILLVVQVFVIIAILKYMSQKTHDSSFNFLEEPEDYWNESDTVFGYLNWIVILAALISFLGSGTGLTLLDYNDFKNVNLFKSVDDIIHPGEQRFYPVNFGSGSSELGISFATELGNVKFSAISDIPKTSKSYTLERNPGSFTFHYLWYSEYFITKNGKLSWDLNTTIPCTVKVYDPNYDEVYYSGFSQGARDTFIAAETGVYTLRLTSDDYSRNTGAEFRSLKVTSDMYDLSQVTIWSSLHDFRLKHTNEKFKYLVAESKDNDIKPDTVSVSLFEYDTKMQSLLYSSMVFCCLLGLSVALFVFVVVLIILQYCGYSCGCTMPKYCCKRRVLVDIDEDDDKKKIKQPLLEKEKEKQATTDGGTTEGGTTEGGTTDGGTADGGTADGGEYVTPDRDATAPSMDENGSVSYTSGSTEGTAPPESDLPAYSQ